MIIIRVQRKKSSKDKYTSMAKYAAAVAIGTIITTTIVTCKSTHSYFTSSAFAEGNISAAPPQDIIACKFERVIDSLNMITEDVPIDFSKPDSENILNPDKIKIYNKTGKDYIVIYFALDDTISKYVRPINPVEHFNDMTETEENEQVKVSEGEVPINVDISLEQFISFLKDKKKDDDVITGEIRVKYLNNYINKAQKISFSKEYLMMRFLKGIQEDLNLKLAQAKAEENSAVDSIGVCEDKAKVTSSNMIAEGYSQTSGICSEENIDDINIELTPEEEQVINYISPMLLCRMNQLIEDKKSLQQIIVALRQQIDSLSQSVSAAAVTSSTASAASTVTDLSASAPDSSVSSGAPADPITSSSASDSTAAGSTSTGDAQADGSATENKEVDSEESNDSVLENSKTGSSPENEVPGNSSSGSPTSSSPETRDQASSSYASGSTPAINSDLGSLAPNSSAVGGAVPNSTPGNTTTESPVSGSMTSSSAVSEGSDARLFTSGEAMAGSSDTSLPGLNNNVAN